MNGKGKEEKEDYTHWRNVSFLPSPPPPPPPLSSSPSVFYKIILSHDTKGELDDFAEMASVGFAVGEHTGEDEIDPAKLDDLENDIITEGQKSRS